MTEPKPTNSAEVSAAAALHCSFCLKSQYEIAKLIAGPGGIFICDECVHLCNEVIAERPLAPGEWSLTAIPGERLLERLKPIEQTIQGHGNMLQTVVEELRKREISWAEIGKALGVSRQSAWERFS